MKYCAKCVSPETKPAIRFDENGVCNFCRYFESLDRVDWEDRKRQFIEIATQAKNKGAQYDCVVGVSGGKDSTYMALYARDVLGLKVLLANMMPECITENGQHNINNLQEMGFDCFMFRPNPKVSRTLAKMAFYKWGNPVKPSEYALYATPVRAAIMYKVPLVIFDIDTTNIDDESKWQTDGDASRINESNTLGFTGDADHLICEGVTKEDLVPYQYPTQEEIRQAEVKMVYHAHFERWSAHHHAMFSIARGLHVRDDNPEDLGRRTNYHALDADIGIMNQMLKHIKFGYGFATDDACAGIWDGTITREEGAKWVREYDGKCAVRYIQEFCDYIGITLDEFWNVTETFRGPMWQKNKIGEWKLKDQIK
ncbi:N-acetyl sugar amidotransferase [Patescibacteria group bacterium]|nr:N-acetyl sugar amidotransferase [Patescibacteria group bacterium]